MTRSLIKIPVPKTDGVFSLLVKSDAPSTKRTMKSSSSSAARTPQKRRFTRFERTTASKVLMLLGIKLKKTQTCTRQTFEWELSKLTVYASTWFNKVSVIFNKLSDSELEFLLNQEPLNSALTKAEKLGYIADGVRGKYSLRRTLEIKTQVDILAGAARAGHINALRDLAELALNATGKLNEFAKTSPQFLKQVATGFYIWPVVISLRKKQLDAAYKMVKTIGLDSALSQTGQISRYELNAPRKWAQILMHHLNYYRLKQGVADGCTTPRLFYVRVSPEECPNIFNAAKRLPPFSKSTAKTHWWPLAEELFRQMTGGKPWEIQELKNYANTTRVTKGFEGRKADGTKFQEILKAIKQAFVTLAPDTP